MGLALICILVAGVGVLPPGTSPGADPCAEASVGLAAHPDDGDARNRLGWCRYRAGSFAEAAAAFEEELTRRPGDADASVGLAYARLQQGDVQAARNLFRDVLRRHAGNGDARLGLSLAALRAPGEELRFEADADPARPMAIPARAFRDYLEIRQEDGSYAPIFVKGVNLGAALPGKYPTEFPRDTSIYLSWFETMAGFGANAVRIYTLLPPEFYRALATHNALAGTRKLWLIQGVWAELPDGNDFDDRDYVEEVTSEIERVIDAVHGDLVTPPRPGHASGIYDADASSSLLAYIVGREWEPYAVKAFNATHLRGVFVGDFFKAENVSAMEMWVARMCNHAAYYEAKRFRTLHPLTFANWPTLDPLRHDTESNRDEEDAWRAYYGIPFPEAFRDTPWENDAVSLDATQIVPTPKMAAGFFAAYHIYPNYPDFLNLEPGYARGPDRYAAYLEELKRYHGHQPVMVAEFGISTSRGVAHVQPEGWDHGGHDERRQAELVARMMSTIHEKGYAGGVLFEFMDEWFKGTWSATPLEIPWDRRRLWFNAQSPEQSYGVIANRPSTPIRVDGDPSDWAGAPYLKRAGDAHRGGWGSLRELRVTSDEGYVYVMLRTSGGPGGPDWSKTSFRLAIDTYDASRGATRLPEPGAATIGSGAEFLLDLSGPGASFITVEAPYEPYAVIDSGPVASPVSATAAATEFVHLMFETNRERIGRDGTRYPAIAVDRGALRFGSLDPAATDFDTRADVAVKGSCGTIELRLPWTLLNVTDPSSRRVLHQETRHDPPLDTTATEGFRIYAFAVDPGRPGRRPLSRLPADDAIAPIYAWETWEAPRYLTEPKHGVGTIRDALSAIPDRIVTPPKTARGADAR